MPASLRDSSSQMPLSKLTASLKQCTKHCPGQCNPIRGDFVPQWGFWQHLVATVQGMLWTSSRKRPKYCQTPRVHRVVPSHRAMDSAVSKWRIPILKVFSPKQRWSMRSMMVLHHLSKVGGINCAHMSARLDLPKDIDADLSSPLKN